MHSVGGRVLRNIITGILMLLFSLSMLPPEVEAKQGGCYKLVSGKDNQMCQLFLQDLNRFCGEPPMVCERKIHPDFAQYFSFPKWKEVDPAEHLEIIAQLIRAETSRNALCADEQCQADWRERQWQKYKVGLLERMKAGQVQLSYARIRPERYSTKENLVYRLVDFPCSPINVDYWNNPQVPKLVVVDEKTERIDQHYADIWKLGAPYDVLLYDGVVFLTVWEGDLPIRGNLRIEEIPYVRYVFQYTGKRPGGKK